MCRGDLSASGWGSLALLATATRCYLNMGEYFFVMNWQTLKGWHDYRTIKINIQPRRGDIINFTFLFLCSYHASRPRSALEDAWEYNTRVYPVSIDKGGTPVNEPFGTSAIFYWEGVLLPTYHQSNQENHKNLRQRRISLWLNNNQINHTNLHNQSLEDSPLEDGWIVQTFSWHVGRRNSAPTHRSFLSYVFTHNQWQTAEDEARRRRLTTDYWHMPSIPLGLTTEYCIHLTPNQYHLHPTYYQLNTQSMPYNTGIFPPTKYIYLPTTAYYYFLHPDT